MNYELRRFLFIAGLLLLSTVDAKAQIVDAKGTSTAAKKEKDAAKKEKAEKKQKAEEEEEVILDVNAAHKDGLFDDEENINYKIKVKSTYKTAQQGNITCQVLTDENKPVTSQKLAINIKHHDTQDFNITIPRQHAGFYKFNVMMNTQDYDDTVRRVFGVSPLKLQSTLHRPADFEDFWRETIADLNTVAPEYKVTFVKERSSKFKKVYQVEMKSYGNITIRGWMVVPTFGHRFPVHYRVPGYGVKMEPNMDADDFIAFDLNVRGNAYSQDEMKSNTDIYSTTGIEDRDRYIYRGTIMDCIRGMEFLHSHYNLGIDTGKIYVEGGSQGGMLGIAVAALDKRVKALTIQVPLYSDIRDTYDISATYPEQVFPFKMFRRYYNTHPGYTWDEFYKVFDYYDPQNFAGR